MTRPRIRHLAWPGAAMLALALLFGTAAATAAVPTPCTGTPTSPTPGDALPFASAVVRSTHNSFSGNIKGSRGSIAYQLDHCVRVLELDLNESGYATTRDYQIGHGGPGVEVDHAGNPASNLLRDWLQQISAWSAKNPNHSPLVVVLDVKNDLTNNPSYAAGNLSALNAALKSVFGSRLVLAKDYPGGLPTIGSLRGRIVTLLSGDANTRTGYRRDLGYHPAVAINERGQVLEVHDSGDGALWYWTGTYGANGLITWQRHGRYGTGVTPTVAVNNNGMIVEVHKSENEDTLWYTVGQLDVNGEIAWGPSRQYDTGVLPTIRFVDAAGAKVREIHRSEGSTQNWDWHGTLTPRTFSVAWNNATHGKTSDQRYDSTSSVSGNSWVQVWTGTDGASTAQTLRYSTGGQAGGRIRYEQVAYTDTQPGSSAVLQEGALFYAGPSTNTAFITAARHGGYVVRSWDFDDPSRATSPLANHPATNYPWISWYESLLKQAGAVN